MLDGLQNMQLTKEKVECIQIIAQSRIELLEECHLRKASIKQAIESTSPKKHFESCVENGIRFENNRVGQ